MKGETRQVKALKRLFCADLDFAAAATATELLIANHEKWAGSPVRRCIETGIIVSYARPFGENDGLGSLPSKFRSLSDQDAQRVHDRILLARNTLEAHTDLLERGALVAGHARGDDTLKIKITLIDGGQTFWDMGTLSLDLRQLKRLLRLIQIQQKAVTEAHHAALRQMFEESPREPGEYMLGIDFP